MVRYLCTVVRLMLIVGMYTEQEIDPAIILNVREDESSSWDLIDTNRDPGSAFAQFTLLRGGSLTVIDSTSRPLQDGFAWVNSNVRFAQIGDDYEVKLTTISGTYANDSSPAASGVFVDVNTSRAWSWIVTGTGSVDFTGILTLREKADTGNQAVATVSIDLDVT